MKNTVHFGFVAIIFIMTLLAFVWLGQIKSSNEKVLDLIGLHDTKINYALTMHNTIRVRQHLMLSMLVSNDPFKLDEKLQRFYTIASEYRLARNALQTLPMSKEEKQMHLLLDEQASISQPINKKAAELFQSSTDKNEIIDVINDASGHQDELLETLQRFVDYQKAQNEVVVKFSRKQFDASVFWLTFFGLIAFFLAALITRFVGESVATKNMELEQAYNKAEEATVIKSEFLATMSHEIRTPLTAIIGFAETTLFKEQTLEQREHATHTIIHSGKHLLKIINDILDLSKVEANKLEIELVEFSLFELLADVDRLVRTTAEDKGLGFTINYIFPLPEMIKGDSLRIEQILINLCNNAIKFTNKGYIVINVSCNCSSSDYGIIFEVVDSGIGISEEELKLIFQAYRQADSSTTRKFGGTGLGLSLSKLLAESMLGTLTVASEKGLGSKFKLFLSLEQLQDASIVFDKEHLPNVKQSKEYVMPTGYLCGNILLAEDNVHNQELLLIYLQRMGLDLDVTIVENGQLAVEAVKDENNSFDLVLMDMRMPIMGGVEAIGLLRKHGFDKPIIALTANAMKEDKDTCFKAGCDGFLTKPIDVIQLNKTLSKFLDVATGKNHQAGALTSSLLENDAGAIFLVERFVKNFQTYLNEVESLIENTEWEKLSYKLHEVKGVSGNLGFIAAASIAKKMEEQAIAKDSDALNTSVAELKHVYKKMLLGIQS